MSKPFLTVSQLIAELSKLPGEVSVLSGIGWDNDTAYTPVTEVGFQLIEDVGDDTYIITDDKSAPVVVVIS